MIDAYLVEGLGNVLSCNVLSSTFYTDQALVAHELAVRHKECAEGG